MAYQGNIVVDDGIIQLLQQAYSHQDKAGSTARVMFFDFCSVFNKIQPLLFGDELRATQVDSPLVPWIMDFLSCGAQFVRLRSCMSGTVVSNTGAPQETVLSPFLFTLYNSDYSWESSHF